MQIIIIMSFMFHVPNHFHNWIHTSHPLWDNQRARAALLAPGLIVHFLVIVFACIDVASIYYYVTYFMLIYNE